MKKLIFIFILLITLTAFSTVEVTYFKQVDFLLAGYRDPVTDEPLSGGKVYIYDDTLFSTPSTVYTDRGGLTASVNPVILDIYGKAEIYADGVFTFVIKTSEDVSVETIYEAEYKSNIADTSALENSVSDIEAVVDALDTTYLKLDASNAPITADLNMGTNKLTNVKTPTINTDASTKGYADDYVGGVVLTAEAFVAGDIIQVSGTNPNFYWNKLPLSTLTGNTSSQFIKIEEGGPTAHGSSASITNPGYTTYYFLRGITYNLHRSPADLEGVSPTIHINTSTGLVTCQVVYATDDSGDNGTIYGSVYWTAISIKD